MNSIDRFILNCKQDPDVPEDLIEYYENSENLKPLMANVLSRKNVDKLRLFKMMCESLKAPQNLKQSPAEPKRPPGRPVELKTLATAKPTNEKAQQRLKESYMATVATELKTYLSIENNPYNRPAVTTFGGDEYIVNLQHKNGGCIYTYSKVQDRPDNSGDSVWVFNGQGYNLYADVNSPQFCVLIEHENQPIRIEVDTNSMLTPDLAPELNDDQILILKYGKTVARETASLRYDKKYVALAEKFIKEEKPEAYKYLKRIPNAYLNDFI
jgi:hypothetical protein